MGKLNITMLLTVVIVQLVVGTLWYGSHLFGDVVTANGGTTVDFLKTDVVSIVLVVLASYGLTFIFDLLTTHTGVKETKDSLKLGLIVGSFAVGLPIIMLLNLIGTNLHILLVIFFHLVVVSMLTSLIVVKLKKTTV
jgi:hypothetical protein